MQYLKGLGYKELQDKSSTGIKENIRQKLSLVNRSRLNGRELLTSEVDEILRKLNTYSIETDSYAFTLNYYIQSSIRIKDLDKKDGSMLGLKIVSNSPSENYWEVARQVTDLGDSYHTRYDVIIFLNEFPVVHIELKDKNVEISEAINQLNRYTRTIGGSLFNYVQLFIVSNGVHTRYGINNNKKIQQNFMFRWSDKNNKIIDRLEKNQRGITYIRYIPLKL